MRALQANLLRSVCAWVSSEQLTRPGRVFACFALAFAATLVPRRERSARAAARSLRAQPVACGRAAIPLA
jgi:hypothetical protein